MGRQAGGIEGRTAGRALSAGERVARGGTMGRGAARRRRRAPCSPARSTGGRDFVRWQRAFLRRVGSGRTGSDVRRCAGLVTAGLAIAGVAIAAILLVARAADGPGAGLAHGPATAPAAQPAAEEPREPHTAGPTESAVSTTTATAASSAPSHDERFLARAADRAAGPQSCARSGSDRVRGGRDADRLVAAGQLHSWCHPRGNRVRLRPQGLLRTHPAGSEAAPGSTLHGGGALGRRRGVRGEG